MTDGTVLNPVELPKKQEHVHTFDDWVNYNDSINLNCESKLYYHICTGCKSIEWTKGTYKDHSFNIEKTAPTCTEKGYTKYTCHCGETYTDSYTNPIEHSPLDLVEENYIEPTCATSGSYDAVVYCRTCENKISSETVILSKEKLHSVSNGICTVCNIPESSRGLSYELNDDEKSYTLIGIGTSTDSCLTIGIYNNLSVTHIAANALSDSDSYGDNYNLERVNISKSVIEISPSAFGEFSHINYIHVDADSDHYKSIDGNLYTKDEKILIRYAPQNKNTNFSIPNTVEVIGQYAFSAAFNLENVNIPNSVKTIEDSAFLRCWTLNGIILPNSVESIGDYAFLFCSGISYASIGAGITSISDSAFYACTNLQNIFVNTNNPVYQSIDGNLYTKTSNILCLYAIGKANSTFIVPNFVTGIGAHAFACCDYLKSIVISQNVEFIERRAFVYCENLLAINFENPKNWSANSNYISSTDLETPSTAATLLVSTYWDAYWTRNR